MSRTLTFFIKPRPGFRASGPEPIIHSDTWMAALRCVAEETGILREAYDGSGRPPFTCSSIFPEVRGVLLFPRPLGRTVLKTGRSGPPNPKDWSRVSFVSQGVLRRILRGLAVDWEPAQTLPGGICAIGREREKLRGYEPWARVRDTCTVVDRRTGAGTPFSRDALRLGADTGLFFLVRFDGDRVPPGFTDLVAALGISGIGSERAAGSGQFEVAGMRESPESLQQNGAGPFVTLSVFAPGRHELAGGLAAGAAARTIVRGGWIYSRGPTGERKRRIRAFVEGSVFEGSPAPTPGEIHDVTPEGFSRPHRVFRDGRAFPAYFRPGSAARAREKGTDDTEQMVVPEATGGHEGEPARGEDEKEAAGAPEGEPRGPGVGEDGKGEPDVSQPG